MQNRTLFATTALQLMMLIVVSIPAWAKLRVSGFLSRVVTATVTLVLGLALFAHRGDLPSVLTVVVANAAIILAHQVWLDALYRLCAIDRPTRRTEALIAAASLASVAALWAFDASPGQLLLAKPRVVASTLPFLWSGVLWNLALYRGAERPWTLGKRYLAWAAAIAVTLNVARAALYLVSDGTQDPVMAGGSFAAILLVNLMGVFTAVGLIMEVETRARTTLIHANDKLVTAAVTDPLTGLGNRRRLEQMTDALIGASRRNDWPITVMMLDIDHFKRINDQWGHAVGDAVLCATAQHCANNLRDHDVLVRWGGEEFSLVLPRCDAHAAALVASRILAAIRSAPLLPVDGQQVTASIGIATLHPEESSFTDAIHRADCAMYRAKSAGRDRHEFHPTVVAAA
jgi:diguanylate cyclase (GGDEF)-like protein